MIVASRILDLRRMSGSCHGVARYTKPRARFESAEGINEKLSIPVNDQESGTCSEDYLAFTILEINRTSVYLYLIVQVLPSCGEVTNCDMAAVWRKFNEGRHYRRYWLRISALGPTMF